MNNRGTARAASLRVQGPTAINVVLWEVGVGAVAEDAAAGRDSANREAVVQQAVIVVVVEALYAAIGHEYVAHAAVDWREFGIVLQRLIPLRQPASGAGLGGSGGGYE